MRFLQMAAARLRRAKQWICVHEWQHQDNSAKRYCLRCGRHEWLFWRRFPMVGEPALQWREMYTVPPCATATEADQSADTTDDRTQGGRNG